MAGSSNSNGRYGLKGSESCGELISSGSFAALRMTAETCHDNSHGHGNGNSHSNGHDNSNDNSNGHGNEATAGTTASEGMG
jgi:hypothetical protein